MNNTLTKATGYLLVAQTAILFSAYIIHFWLGRFFSIELYGSYGIVITFVNLAVLSFFGIQQAISKNIAENIEKKAAIKAISTKIQIVFSFIVWVIYIIVSTIVAKYFFTDSSLIKYFWLSSIIIPIYGLSSIYTAYFNGTHNFKKQAIQLLIFAFSKLIFMLFLAYYFSLSGILIGFALAAFMVLVYGYINTKTKESIKEKFNGKKIINLAVPITLFILAFNLFMSLDLILIKAVLKDNIQTAYYTSAALISKIPYSVLSVLALITLPSIASSIANNLQERTSRIINQSLRFLFLFLAPTALLISATSKELISLIYPSPYVEASLALSILIFGISFLIVFFVVASIFNAANKPYTPLIILIFLLPLLILLNIILIPKFGIVGAAISTTISGFILMISSSILLYKKFKTFPSFKSIIKILFSSLIIFILAKTIDANNMLLILKYIFLFSIYFIILIITKEITKHDIEKVKSLIIR